jgi:hypothetical protein
VVYVIQRKGIMKKKRNEHGSKYVVTGEAGHPNCTLSKPIVAIRGASSLRGGLG